MTARGVTREQDLAAIGDVLMAARDVQEFLWAAETDAHKHPPEVWLKILRKRFDKLAELDTTQPHWQVEFRKRVLQLGAVSVRILAHTMEPTPDQEAGASVP